MVIVGFPDRVAAILKEEKRQQLQIRPESMAVFAIAWGLTFWLNGGKGSY